MCAASTSCPASLTRTRTSAPARAASRRRTNWAFLANLAFGMTTMHDPSNNTAMIFSTSETDQGRRDHRAASLLDRHDSLWRRRGHQGDHDVVRRCADASAAHAGRRRIQREELQPAAPRCPTADHRSRARAGDDGGSGRRATFSVNTTMVLDGHTTLEHNMPVAPLYEDVLRLMRRPRPHTRRRSSCSTVA